MARSQHYLLSVLRSIFFYQPGVDYSGFSSYVFGLPRTHICVALHTGLPGFGSTALNELSTVGTGYARVHIPATADYWGVEPANAAGERPGPAIAYCKADLVFGPAITNWGVILYASLRGSTGPTDISSVGYFGFTELSLAVPGAAGLNTNVAAGMSFTIPGAGELGLGAAGLKFGLAVDNDSL